MQERNAFANTARRVGPEQVRGSVQNDEQMQQSSTVYDARKDVLRDQREIKFLILKGYAISVENTNTPDRNKFKERDWLREFLQNLAKSKSFYGNENDKVKLIEVRNTGNLSGFKIALELKEPLKK